MDERETFVRSDRALLSVIEQVEDDQWDRELPDDFPTLSDQTFTLREMVEYQAYDEAWIPAMMAGRTTAEVGEDTFGGPFDNTLLDDDPKRRFADLVATSIEAVESLDDADLDDRTVHYSYGDYPVREALWHAIVFRATRAVDIARVIGVDPQLPDELVPAVWQIVEPNAAEWRAMGVFGPEIPVPDDAPLQDRLLALTGRQP